MAVYEVFSHSLRVRYKANLCSKTTLFYLVTQILTLILPVTLIYSEGKWTEHLTTDTLSVDKRKVSINDYKKS